MIDTTACFFLSGAALLCICKSIRNVWEDGTDKRGYSL